MTRPPTPLLIGLALFLLLSTVPGALAQVQQPGFGDIVGDLADTDAEHVVSTSGAPDEIRYRDSDSDDVLDAGEAVFLTEGSTAQQGDVRLANPIDGSTFTKLAQGDDDAGLSLDPLSGSVRYFDADHSGALNAGDTVYYDRTGSGEEKVSSNDVILAGDGAGTLVSSGHDELNFQLSSFDRSPVFGYYDTDDDDTFDSGEASVIDTDDDDYVTVSDVRLGSTTGGSGGSIVEAGDGDVTYVLQGFSETWELRHRDPDGDESFDANEGAYISKGASVATFAVRIANSPSDFDEGTQVIEAHTDYNLPTIALSGSFRYLDQGGTSGFDGADILYYDLSGSDSGQVSNRDIVLTGPDAGEQASGHGHIGESLDSYSGSILFFDADGNGNYNGGDVLYADTDNDDIVKSYDIQLSDGTNPYADGDDGEDPASINITTPADGSFVAINETVTIEGTASGGGASIDEITATATGGEHTLGGVTGTSDWSVPFTPEQAGTFTITVTVAPTTGDSVSASITLTANEQGFPDEDGDGVPDGEDNCPATDNPEQEDADGDGTGDACDPDQDSDGDGVADLEDNCPDTANDLQADMDGDGTGDACDDDIDGDGVPNEEDAFPEDASETQDQDGDGVGDNADNCPQAENADQADMDDDGTGDACDGDIDGDGLANAAERAGATDERNPDTDGDGVQDGEDNCPVDENPDQADDDEDGVGDACDEEEGVPAPGLLAVLLAAVLATAVRGRKEP